MKKIIYIVLMACIFAACSEDVTLFGDNASKKVISISAEYPVITQTRATDNGFTNNDKVGVFVVDYEGENAGVMALSGNRASNVMLTYNESTDKWSAPMTLYWATDGTPADIIGYYPFVENLESTIALPFTIRRDQNGNATETAKGGYEQSDWLWAKATKVSPTSETISLKYQHVMAGLNIRLERGDGFTAEEWAQMEKTVLVTNTQLNGFVNLTTGTTTLDPQSFISNSITALTYGDAWRAVVLPQTIEAGKALISITVDGQSYHLTKSEVMSYLAGKMHNFTIEVNRRTAGGDFEFKLLDEVIVPWETDADFHDGLTRAYVMVHVKEPGTLKQKIAQMGLDYTTIANLKVTGGINRHDMEFMGQEMELLMNLNLQNSIISEDSTTKGILSGFEGHTLLRHIVFPNKGLKGIGEKAFMGTSLNGSLELPEGLEHVGHYAFYGCKYTGNLILPSTLKDVGQYAFSDQFTGTLMLPKEIRFFDTSPFSGCDFSGPVIIPNGIKSIPFLGFSKATGDIIIPQGQTQIPDWVFYEGGYDGMLVLPEGIVSIGAKSFAKTNIHGETKLPSTLKFLGNNAFEGTRINRVIFENNVISIGNECFKDCHYLTGTVSWPIRCNIIPTGVFNGCENLSQIVIHKDVRIINDNAFLKCKNLMRIICECEEPPIIGENAFLGTPKADITIIVPNSAVARYKNAEGWSDFKRIVANSNLSCEPASVCALNKEHQEKIVLFANGEWTVTHIPDWCTISETSGRGKKELTLTVSQMPHSSNHRIDSIVFTQRSDNGVFNTYCQIAQYNYQYEEDHCMTLQQHSRGNGIDIVFVGDGWDAASIADNGYFELIEYQTECLFSIEPYRSMRDYFNVYVTFPMSQERGVNTLYTYVNNKFGTLQGRSSIGFGCSMETCKLIIEEDEVIKYVKDRTPVKDNCINKALIVVVPNTTDYKSNTLELENSTISICPPSVKEYPYDTRGYVQYEIGGHGFGKLGDETIYWNQTISEYEKTIIRLQQQQGWYMNLSVTGKMNEMPWADFIFDPDYSDHVDVYEGGYGYIRGVYRAEEYSCMNSYIPYYNTPSRLAIWKRIKEYAGETWTMEEFRKQDTFEWGPTKVQANTPSNRWATK